MTRAKDERQKRIDHTGLEEEKRKQPPTQKATWLFRLTSQEQKRGQR
jgi:hypothetical protein